MFGRKRANTENDQIYIGKIFGTVADVLSVLAYIGISVSVLAAWLKKNWCIGVIAVGAIVCLLVVRHCKKNFRRIVAFILGLFAPKFPYRMDSWNVEYEYKSMSEMAFRAKYGVNALQAGVDHIRVRYSWSGETAASPVVPKPYSSAEENIFTAAVEEDGREFGYKYYKVYSKTAYNKGDPVFWLGTTTDLVCADQEKISHHLMTNISVVTERLNMKVILPRNIKPNNVQFFEYLHSTDYYHWHTYRKEAKLLEDGRRIIEWDIEKPIIGGKYLISWIPEETA